MAIGRSCDELMIAIGYTFYDSDILQNALTHSSYSNEYKNKGHNLPSNERLEFLGDAVLEIVISEYLYDNFKSYGEGKLTRMRQNLVCEKTLARMAEKLSLGEYVHLGNGEESECRTRPKVLADTFEAVMAAVYLDCKAKGSDEYKSVITKIFMDEFSESANYGGADFKTALQQFIEKDGSAILEYVVISENGPEHKKEFTIAARVNNNVVGTGTAFSKKDAEQMAARAALELFGLKG